jgi:hypothetical protein
MSAIVDFVRRISFFDWLSSLFKSDAPVTVTPPKLCAPEPEPEPEQIEVYQEEAAEVESEAPARKSRPNLSQLLHELDRTWENLGRATKGLDDFPTLAASDLDGLKRLGPLVLPGRSWETKEDVAKFDTDNSKLPMTMFIAINDGEQTDSESHAPDFFFAIKIRKMPWNVAKKPGQAFQIGMGWRTLSGSVIWGQFYAYVNAGKVYPAHWLCNQQVNVPGGAYSKRVWDVSSWSMKKAGNAVEIVFSNAIASYQERFESWNVSVNKDGRRATFLIDKKDTAYAFKDRNGTALAADGKRKRIIHFVQAHRQHRANGTVVDVPAHIRGLREFQWNGYQCFVTSPQHHKFMTASVTLAGEDVPEDEEPNSEKMLSLYEAAEKLVRFEDQGNSRRKKAA